MFRYGESIDRLIKTGFSQEQAVAQFTVFEDFMMNKVATTEDIKRLEFDFITVGQRFNEIEGRLVVLDSKIENLRIEFSKIEIRLIKKIAALIGAIEAIKYFWPG